MEWDGKLYEGSHAFVSEYGLKVLDMLGGIKGKRVLDAGCGTGTLAAEAARRGALVTGVDADENMLAAAHEKFPGLKLEKCRLEEYRRDKAFDCAYSNAVLHWIADQNAVIKNIYGSLIFGGKFACEFGGTGNANIVLSALKQALAEEKLPFNSPFHYRGLEFKRVLEGAGFTVKEIELFPRMTPLKGEDGMANWIIQFCRDTLPGGEWQSKVLRRVENSVRGELYFDGVWHVDYMRLRFLAEK